MNLHLAIGLIMGAFVLGYLLTEWTYHRTQDVLLSRITRYSERINRLQRSMMNLRKENEHLRRELQSYHAEEFERAVKTLADQGLLHPEEMDQH